MAADSLIFDLNETQEDATQPAVADALLSDAAEEQEKGLRDSELQCDDMEENSEGSPDQHCKAETEGGSDGQERDSGLNEKVDDVDKATVEKIEAEPSGAKVEEPHSADITLPLSRVKRLVKLDPDIRTVSSEALKTIAIATELFLGSLAVSTAQVTRAGKRSTLKVDDLLQVVRTRRRYQECLGTELDRLRPIDANQAANAEARKQEKAARPLPPGVKPITNFFK